MCPACLAGAGLMLASAVSTGGLTALIVRFRSKIALKKIPAQILSKESNS
jgi:hypothetical protein